MKRISTITGFKKKKPENAGTKTPKAKSKTANVSNKYKSGEVIVAVDHRLINGGCLAKREERYVPEIAKVKKEKKMATGNQRFVINKPKKKTRKKKAAKIKKNQYLGQDIEMIFIPSNIVSIKEFAFRDCKKLREVMFEQNSKIQSISSFAFSGCSSLKKINFPKKIISVYGTNFDFNKNINTEKLIELMIKPVPYKVKAKRGKGGGYKSNGGIPSPNSAKRGRHPRWVR